MAAHLAAGPLDKIQHRETRKLEELAYAYIHRVQRSGNSQRFLSYESLRKLDHKMFQTPSNIALMRKLLNRELVVSVGKRFAAFSGQLQVPRKR